MSDMTDQQRLQIWRHSISLAASPVYFAHPSKKETYEALRSKSALEAGSKAIEDAQKSGLTGLKAITEILTEPPRILSEQSAIMASLRSDIVSWCQRGILKAVGYEAPRKLEHSPIELPMSAWKGKVHWEKSRIEFQGLTFIEVRLTTSKISQEIASRFRPKENQRGRPTIQPDLFACIESLMADGLIDPQRSMASHYPSIRKRYELHAKAHKLTKTNVSDEAIRVIFSPIFNALKKSRKQ